MPAFIQWEKGLKVQKWGEKEHFVISGEQGKWYPLLHLKNVLININKKDNSKFTAETKLFFEI